jgi:probable F420-dependent oxidoreductase
MKFDVTVFSDDLNTAGDLAKTVEDYGFDGLWVAEAAHNPFLPLIHAAQATHRINLGTAIAVAFPRSPMIMAQTVWDLAEQSNGRFILGLGTQIKPHITKRFSATWGKPVTQLREYIQSLRAIWHSFQTSAPLQVQGEYYNFSSLPPAFSPTPMPHHDIPIYIAGVNTGLAKLGGERCDGFHVHSFHTPDYLRQVLVPAIEEGGQRTGRTRADVDLSCAVFVVTGRNNEETEASKIATKSQIAFYASTPSYSKVLELHGWQDLIPELNVLLRRNKWDEMHTLISDDMLDHFAVVAPPDELPYKVRERYEGLLDRVGFYFPFEPSDDSKRIIWEHASKAMEH